MYSLSSSLKKEGSHSRSAIFAKVSSRQLVHKDQIPVFQGSLRLFNETPRTNKHYYAKYGTDLTLEEYYYIKYGIVLNFPDSGLMFQIVQLQELIKIVNFHIFFILFFGVVRIISNMV
ncbi:hypothetical protein CAEBREN_00326 [Caenorhabditis brenneri]|uniref:PAZ domain-containing protein n=1 Tax=Caenorhabditis brenneri TaxID=135651 RepID=G0ND01_CAEBE|nr:hypothetical protein CAEBREN_00326 [Caenorhabditis brenneri]